MSKKFLTILLLTFFLGGNFSRGQTDATNPNNGTEITLPASSYDNPVTSQPSAADTVSTTNPNPTSSTASSYDTTEDETFNGITIGPNCLANGQCKFNIYDALGIRTSVRNEGDPTSVGLFVQDIVLSATMFIGTIVVIAIIVSGLMRIFAGASGKDPTKAKTGLINAIIGLLIVVSSFLIIRTVQYIAKGF